MGREAAQKRTCFGEDEADEVGSGSGAYAGRRVDADVRSTRGRDGGARESEAANRRARRRAGRRKDLERSRCVGEVGSRVWSPRSSDLPADASGVWRHMLRATSQSKVGILACQFKLSDDI